MKKSIYGLLACCLIFNACQKSISTSVDEVVTGTDSLIKPGDTLTYEVLTDEPEGWFGVWNDPEEVISCNPLDSITFGSPVYNFNGWRHSFVCPATPFQPFISVASKLYDKNITANLYRNGQLIKSVTNDAMKGVAKFLLNSGTDTLTGTATSPVLTYEVLITNADTTKFEPDAWTGQWNMPDGKVCDLDRRLIGLFALPSGWRYSFKPEHLPFVMYVGGSPYTPGAATITLNFYKNAALVKTVSSQNYLYGNQYLVE